MKKSLLWIMPIVLLVSCLLCGCSSQMVGVYRFYSMQLDGGDVGYVGERYMGATLTEDFLSVELQEDGSVIIFMTEDISTGTWEFVSDGKIKVTINEETRIYMCDGKELRMEYGSLYITLKK